MDDNNFKEDVFETVYIVNRVFKKAEYFSPLTGKVMETEFKDIVGYIPIYKTYEEAFIKSEEGKYGITPIRIQK